MDAEMEILYSNDARVREWLDQLPLTAHALLFGGDRWLGVTHVAVAVVTGKIVALASIVSSTDKRPQPEVVSVYTLKAHRGRGYGYAVLLVAVKHLLDGNVVNLPVCVEAISRGGLHMVHNLPETYRLPGELHRGIQIIDKTGPFDDEFLFAMFDYVGE